MATTWTVETLNLGRRPVPGISPATERFDDEAAAGDRLRWVVGDLLLQPGLTVVDDPPPGGDVIAGQGDVVRAVRFAHRQSGGRIEVLLRRRTDGDGDPRVGSDATAAPSVTATRLPPGAISAGDAHHDA